MIYHLNLTQNGKRVTIILEYTSQEYGVSEQSFWSCWMAHKKQNCGDGDTLEAAFEDMITQMEYREEMWRISAELRENFNKTILGANTWRVPVVQNE